MFVNVCFLWNHNMVDALSWIMRVSDLPSQLTCFLCSTIFKVVVMIPCYQHSFCEQCIRSVLSEEVTCPKCSSAECRVEDLLPNISLRQAIQHYLKTRNLTSAPDNIAPKYAPDEESGIQAQEVSATARGYNQIMTIPAYDPVMREKVPANYMMGMRRACASFVAVNPKVCRNGLNRRIIKFFGAPCGIMDQMTLVRGETIKLLAMVC